MTKAVARQSTADNGLTKKRTEVRSVPVASWRSQPASVLAGPLLQRKPACACGGGCPRCQRAKASEQSKVEPHAAALVNEAETTAGAPLPADLAQRFSAGLGVDLSDVRVHTGAHSMRAAEAVAAKAYTTGQNIHFAAGQYDPATPAGQHLLAHEVVHTVQQGGRASMQQKLEVSQPGDALELEADRVADAVTSGSVNQPVTASVQQPAARQIARQPESAAKPADKQAAFNAAAVLPFSSQTVGEGGWDSAAILQAAEIPSDSEAGKAISGGPDKVSQLSLEMAKQTAAEAQADASMTFSRYLAALLHASLSLTAFGVSVTLRQATYGGLIDFALLRNVLTRGGEEKKLGLIAWASPTQAATPVAPTQNAQATIAQTGSLPQDGQGTVSLAITENTPEMSDFRQKVMKRLAHWAGAVEGSDLFAEFMTDQQLENARKDAGREHITFTTCIAFQGRVLEEVGDYNAGRTPKDVKPPIVVGTTARIQAMTFDAWHEGRIGMDKTERPKIGDLYLLYDQDNHNTFSHIGYIESFETIDGTEYWNTVDGGQGTATNYDDNPDPKKQQIKAGTTAGKEELKRNHREYKPAENLLHGEAIQRKEWSWVRGWIDVDKLPHSQAELKAMEPKLKLKREEIKRLEEEEKKLEQKALIKQIADNIARLNKEAAEKKAAAKMNKK